MTVTGFCMSCGKKDKENGKGKPMKDVKMTMTSRGGYMAKGKCQACGGGMCAIMSKVNAEKAVADGDAEKTY